MGVDQVTIRSEGQTNREWFKKLMCEVLGLALAMTELVSVLFETVRADYHGKYKL